MKIYAIGITIVLLNIPSIYAVDILNQLGFSFSNSGVGIFYDITNRFGSEIKYNPTPDMYTLNLRGYYNFYQEKWVAIPFIGIEFGKVGFNTSKVQGAGTLANLFVGIKYFIARTCFIGMDLGYEYMTLSAAGFTVNGPEYIYNLSLNLYYTFFLPEEENPANN